MHNFMFKVSFAVLIENTRSPVISKRSRGYLHSWNIVQRPSIFIPNSYSYFWKEKITFFFLIVHNQPSLFTMFSLYAPKAFTFWCIRLKSLNGLIILWGGQWKLDHIDSFLTCSWLVICLLVSFVLEYIMASISKVFIQIQFALSWM